jgi:hypothetical protein
MVQAILAGRKTQTRRFLHEASGQFWGHAAYKPAFREDGTWGWYVIDSGEDAYLAPEFRCPYGVPGDRLWVRETWASRQEDIVAYRANGECGAWMGDGGGGRLWVHHGWIHGATDNDQPGRWFGLEKYGGRWQPSIHMPRWASRITLELTEVRIQRLQEISEEDAKAEGVEPCDCHCQEWAEWCDGNPHRHGFAALWRSTNAKRGHGWDTNPWIWAITFKRGGEP